MNNAALNGAILQGRLEGAAEVIRQFEERLGVKFDLTAQEVVKQMEAANG